MAAIAITDTFLALLYRHAGDGSHIITVVGVEHDPAVTVFQRYRGEMSWEEHFNGLFNAVQDTLDGGELCVILLRSLIGQGVDKPPRIELRAWTLTPVGIIPVSAADLAHQTHQDPQLASQAINVVHTDGWDQDLDLSA